MHRVAELLGRRRLGIVLAEIGVIGLVAVGAPIALHLACVRVEHCHALVEIAVGDVGLVGLGIDPDLGHAAEVFQVVAAGVLAMAAHLHQELAVAGEFEHVRVLGTVAADPHIALVVDVHAVVGVRPFVTRPGSAPGAHQVARLVEYQHRRRRRAALAHLQVESLFIVVQGRRATMDDPHVVLVVHPYADHHAEQPVVGQGLGPERVHLEHRRLHRARLRFGLVLQHGLADAERGDERGNAGACVQVASGFNGVHIFSSCCFGRALR